VNVGVGMAVGPGDSDPEVLNVVDGVLRHASVPVLFRPFGGHWQLRGDLGWAAVGLWGVGWGKGTRRRQV
jgi:hypothetical protein